MPFDTPCIPKQWCYFVFHSVSDAKAYVDFILNSIHRKDLFHSIEIKPESCWEYLMWMDQVKNNWIMCTKLKASAVECRSITLIKTLSTAWSKLNWCPERCLVDTRMPQWNRVGAVVRALVSPKCVLGLIPTPSIICRFSMLLVLCLAPRGFSPVTPVFPLSSSTNISKFQFDLDYCQALEFYNFYISLNRQPRCRLSVDLVSSKVLIEGWFRVSIEGLDRRY